MKESLRKKTKYIVPLLGLLMFSPVIYVLFTAAWYIGITALAGLLIIIIDIYEGID